MFQNRRPNCYKAPQLKKLLFLPTSVLFIPGRLILIKYRKIQNTKIFFFTSTQFYSWPIFIRHLKQSSIKLKQLEIFRLTLLHVRLFLKRFQIPQHTIFKPLKTCRWSKQSCLSAYHEGFYLLAHQNFHLCQTSLWRFDLWYVLYNKSGMQK